MTSGTFKAALVAAGLLAGQQASAATVFGVYGDSASQAASVAQGDGYSASVLSTLTAADLKGLNVLWVLNGSNGGQSSGLLNNSAAVAAFVNGGGVLIYNDRAVTGANLALPGATTISFVQSFTSNIDVQNATTPLTNGITNSTLDGGNYSAHGYVVGATLPGSGHGILNNGTSNDFVDSYYSYGAGTVYYSAIPLDFYLSGNNPAAFRTTYASNLAAEGAALVAPAGAVPEPAAWAMMIVGVGAIGFAMRRRQAITTRVSFA